MPLYEYQCQNCKALRDIRHGFDETTSEVCSACGGPLVRLFRAAGIVFKGSGFYVTDSRKSSGSSGDGGSTSSEPAKTESAPAKTDAAPAAKSESPAPAPAPKSDAPAA